MRVDFIIWTLFSLCGLFFVLWLFFYMIIYPLIRAMFCRVGNVYYKKYKKDNPFDTFYLQEKTYTIIDKKNGYVKYEEKKVFNDKGHVYTRTYVDTMKTTILFSCFIKNYKRLK